MEVKVTSIWDGKDIRTRKIADLSLLFPDVIIPIWQIDPFRNLKFLEDVDKELQPIADRCFGRGLTIVQGAEVKAGSLEILLWLLSAGTAVYKFFKDYEFLRKGIMLFARDIETAGKMIQILIKRHYIEKKGPSNFYYRKNKRNTRKKDE